MENFNITKLSKTKTKTKTKTLKKSIQKQITHCRLWYHVCVLAHVEDEMNAGVRDEDACVDNERDDVGGNCRSLEHARWS